MNKFIRKSDLNNQKGIALVMVMIVMLVMIILITGLVVITVSNNKQSDKSIDNTSVYYIAEAGINYQLQAFKNKTNELANLNVDATTFINTIDTWILSTENKKRIDFSTNKNKTSYTLITAIKTKSVDPNYQAYTFTSKGFIGNTSRTLTKTIQIKYVSGDLNGFIVDKAVLTSGNLNVDKAKITGPAESYSTIPPAIVIAGGGSVETLTIPAGTNVNTIVSGLDSSCSQITAGGCNGIKYATKAKVFPKILLPAIPSATVKLSSFTTSGKTSALINSTGDITINSNTTSPNQVYNLDSNQNQSTYTVPNFSVSGSPTFTLNVGSMNINLVTDNLSMNGTFKVTGTGKLTIYVKASTSTGHFSMNIGNGEKLGFILANGIWAPQKLVIFIGQQGTGYFTQSMSQGAYYLSIMAANMNLSMSGQAEIFGYVATNGNSISMTGNGIDGATMYFAPNAVFSMSGNAVARGAIIASSFTSSGNNISVIYDPSAFNNFPFEILDPVSGGGTTLPTVDIIKGATKE